MTRRRGCRGKASSQRKTQAWFEKNSSKSGCSTADAACSGTLNGQQLASQARAELALESTRCNVGNVGDMQVANTTKKKAEFNEHCDNEKTKVMFNFGALFESERGGEIVSVQREESGQRVGTSGSKMQHHKEKKREKRVDSRAKMQQQHGQQRVGSKTIMQQQHARQRVGSEVKMQQGKEEQQLRCDQTRKELPITPNPKPRQKVKAPPGSVPVYNQQGKLIAFQSLPTPQTQPMQRQSQVYWGRPGGC